jgi:hypothetical protein
MAALAARSCRSTAPRRCQAAVLHHSHALCSMRTAAAGRGSYKPSWPYARSCTQGTAATHVLPVLLPLALLLRHRLLLGQLGLVLLRQEVGDEGLGGLPLAPPARAWQHQVGRAAPGDAPACITYQSDSVVARRSSGLAMCACKLAAAGSATHAPELHSQPRRCTDGCQPRLGLLANSSMQARKHAHGSIVTAQAHRQ